jgi:hypothetical protein
MAELAPIRDLVESFSKHPEAIKILREAHKRRPAIMLGEFLDKLKALDHAAYNQPERREPRSLKNHPLNPSQR